MSLSLKNIRKPLLGVMMLSTAGMVLTACSTPQNSYPPVSVRNPIQVAETVERLELYARPEGMSLSARDEDAVANFLHTYGRFGDGPLYVNAPNRPSAGAGIAQTHGLLSKLMGQVGLSTARVETGQYHAAHQGPAPIIVSYRRLKTIPQDCRGLGNMTMTYNNQPYDNFGCSANANLAAMVEDPRQLLEPYPLAPPVMQRRSTVYDRYIEGENPASEQPARQQVSAEEN